LDNKTSIAAYATSATTSVFGAITLSDFALWVGILTSVGTFALNWYYKSKEAKARDV
jgi:hypothetical protein